MKEISDLPHEILMRCFYSLAPPDLKSCVLVSEEWRAVGEDPSLWTWCTVTIRSREDLDKLSVRRLRKIQRIRIEQGEDWGVGDREALLQDVAAKKYPKLKQICGLGWANLFSVNIEPEVIARAVVQLEDVDLSFGELTTEQITSILTNIAREDTKLKKLDLCGYNLSGIEPEALARGVVQLEEVNLIHTKLTTEQITSILTNIAREDTKLKKLYLLANNLSGVETEALARGVVQLEEVNLIHTKLTTEQITSIFTNITRVDTKLKKLHMKWIDLSGVEPQALARGVVQLEEVNLTFTELTTEQMTSILTNVAREEAKLKKLFMRENNTFNVEPDVIRRAQNILQEFKYD